MREVAVAHAASVTQSSRQTRCESVIHAVSKPSRSASWTWRTTSGSGSVARIATSNFTRRVSCARPDGRGMLHLVAKADRIVHAREDFTRAAGAGPDEVAVIQHASNQSLRDGVQLDFGEQDRRSAG